jgi:hypothetical protein
MDDNRSLLAAEIWRAEFDAALERRGLDVSPTLSRDRVGRGTRPHAVRQRPTHGDAPRVWEARQAGPWESGVEPPQSKTGMKINGMLESWTGAG